MSEDPRARRTRRLLWLMISGFLLFNALVFLSTCG